MSEQISRAIENLRDKHPCRVYVAATGGGSGIQKTLSAAGVQKLLTDVPGISNFFIGSAFPYAQSETEDFLGFAPERSASEETAVDLAMQAYLHAYKPGGAPAIGLGVTASIASLKAHRGDHRIFSAYFSDAGCGVFQYTLPKGEGAEQRLKDGELCDLLGLRTLFAALPGTLPIPEFPGDVVNLHPNLANDMARERLFAHPMFRADRTRGSSTLDSPKDTVIFPGAFNPPHEGHYGCADVVRRTHGKDILFNITVNPPHKKALTTAEILQRAKLFKGKSVLFTQDDPLYIDKAKRYPGVNFIIGADAVLRMLDPKWGVAPGKLLQMFFEYGTKFHVFERATSEGLITSQDIWVALSDVVQYDHLFYIEKGRWDVSSSELRAKAKV